MMTLSPTIDVYEAVILLLFLGAVAAGVYSIVDAWRNLLAAITSEQETASLMGLVDFLLMVLLFSTCALPGVILSLVLFTITSPIQEGSATPQELVASIVLRVVLILISLSLFIAAVLSMWLRQKLAGDRERRLKALAASLPVVEAPAVVLAPDGAPAAQPEGERPPHG